MNHSNFKVLFISHQASRSGAPIVLLHLLKWIKNNTSLHVEILLLHEGPLKDQFEQIGKTFLISDLTKQNTAPEKIKSKLFNKTADDYNLKAAVYLAKRKYDLVYGNTVLSLPLLKCFKKNYSLKTVCCIHELSYSLNYLFTKEYLSENLSLMDGIIAVSQAVKDNLVNTYQLPVAKIKLHYEFIDSEVAFESTAKPSLRKLGIDDTEFVIGMGGTPEWRKGTDLMIPLVLKLIASYPDFKFRLIWLGANLADDFVVKLLYDAEKCGISDRLLFIENKPDPLAYINRFDIFVLLSREDPFPLIALEAAFLKKPILAFENSGGMPELIEQGAGLLAPYLNLTELANLTHKLSGDKQLIKKLGNKARDLVITMYNTAVIAPAIFNDMVTIITVS